jgi:hypothetical protein
MTPAERLDAFIDRYTPEVASQARSVLAKMRELLPGAFEIVYDTYNALVIGFGPTARTSEFLFSIALYPRYVTLFFAEGAALPDPGKRLVGTGKTIRSIRLERVDILDEPDVRALMDAAIARSTVPFDSTRPNQLEIRSISAKQRPRRPA